MNEIVQPRVKKPTIYTLELETYLSNVQEKADKISDRFIIMFFVLGLFLAPVYDTWKFTLVTSIATVGLYSIARFVLTNKFMARMVISLVYSIFMLQFIGQMHGMAEVHFFFFINIALLIIYQDWRIMIPYTVFAIGHHSFLAILQANAADFGLENSNLPNYFIGFGGRTIEGENVDYITTFQLFFHFGLAAMMAFICGWWAVIFRENSIQLMEKQLEEQAKNEELRSSQEELRQNSDKLQSTNDQMVVIQNQIEEKQNLLNKAEKLVGLASYEIDLATRKLTSSDNLSFIYGDEKLDTIQKIIEIAHPEDAQKVIETITQASKGEIQDYDISYRSKGKHFDHYKYYRAIGELINDERDNPEKLVGTVQDITNEVQQKQHIEEILQKVQSSEEELRQNYEELQTTQEELNIQKKRLEQIFDGVPAMIYQFEMTKEGKVSFPVVSKGSEATYGLPAQTIMKDANSIISSIHEDDQLNFQNSLAESAHNLTDWNADVRVVINGKTQWIRGNSKPVKDKEGTIIWSGIVQEITKQKELEQEINIQNENLLASEEELKQNLEELQTTQDLVNNAFSELDAQFTAISATLGYAEISTDKKIERVNKLFADWLGYSVDELQGKSHFSLIYDLPEDKERCEKLWKTLEEGNTYSDVFKRKNKEGKEVWLYGAYCPVKDKNGNTTKIIKIVSNYNEQKEFEDKIKLNNNRLQNLIENVGDLVFLLDRNFVFKEYYASSDKDLVLKPEKFLGKKITEINFPQKPLQKVIQALQEAIDEKEKATTEYQLELAHQTEWFSLIISPILNEKREVEDILCVTRNITYIKQTEIAVQKQNELLSQQKKNIESAFNELQTTQSQLIQSEKMASLGQLVANIAHEINTPLGAIRSSATSIEQILEQTLPALPSFLKKLDEDMLTLFNEFVTLSSQKTDTLSSREKRTIKYELIEKFDEIALKDADEFADWIVDMNMYDEKALFIPLLQNANAKQILQIAYQLSTIIRSNRTVKTATDRAAKIVFALKNFARQDHTGEKSIVNINESIETTLTLYHNQIKHGIDVTRDLGNIPEFMGYPDQLIQVWTNIIHNAIQAMKNNGKLFIQTIVKDNTVLISIQDNGGGIPKNAQDRVFDAFFTTKLAGEGSGLGLDITKKIIEKHNGKIWFETLEEIGTTFFIQIPLNQ